jgi:hypothetical protein
MCCLLCVSGTEAEFSAELMVHFSGLENLDKPGALVFSKILVCLDCGYPSQYSTSTLGKKFSP